MAAAGDGEGQTVVDFGAHVIALDRERRQRRGDVDDGERIGRLLDRDARSRDRGGEPLENLKLERQRPVGGVGDLRFKLAELGGREAHLAGERLPMDEGGVERRGEQLLAMLGGDVDKIAEHIVVPDFQRADAGRLGIADLQRGDDAARFVAQRARLVERPAHSRRAQSRRRGATPATRRQARRLSSAASAPSRHGAAPRRHGRGRAADLRERRKPLGDFRRCENSVADGGEVARSAAADHDAGQCARQIWRRFQPLAQVGARGRHR